MNSSKTIAIFAIIALIMLFVYPIQSMPTNENSVKSPTRHKRWTFNTWRLHGRRDLSNNFYSPMTSSDGDRQYEIFNNEENAARVLQDRLLQFFPELNRQ